MALFQRGDSRSRRYLIGLGMGGPLQDTHVGDNRPPVRGYHLETVGWHGTPTLGNDVEDVPVGELHHAVLGQIGWLPNGNVGRHNAVAHPGLVVTRRTVDVELG